MEMYEKYLHVDYFSRLRVQWYATARKMYWKQGIENKLFKYMFQHYKWSSL